MLLVPSKTIRRLRGVHFLPMGTCTHLYLPIIPRGPWRLTRCSLAGCSPNAFWASIHARSPVCHMGVRILCVMPVSPPSDISPSTLPYLQPGPLLRAGRERNQALSHRHCTPTGADANQRVWTFFRRRCTAFLRTACCPCAPLAAPASPGTPPGSACGRHRFPRWRGKCVYLPQKPRQQINTRLFAHPILTSERHCNTMPPHRPQGVNH